MSNVRPQKEGAIDHWECKVCNTPVEEDLHECWKCHSVRPGYSHPKSKPESGGLGGFGIVMLVITIALVAFFGLGFLIVLDAARWAK